MRKHESHPVTLLVLFVSLALQPCHREALMRKKGPQTQPKRLASSSSDCTPGWTGQLLVAGESLDNWSVEAHDQGSSGTLEAASGFIGAAVRLNWNIASGDWVQAKYTFPQPLDLSRQDIFGASLKGSSGIANRVSIMVADTNGVFFGLNCDGVNTISRWMKNLPLPKKMFYHFFTIGPDPNKREIDWAHINRFFVVVKRLRPGDGGGSGQITIDHVQADRAADWPRQQQFETVTPNPAVVTRAVRYVLDQRRKSGLFLSWKEEPEPNALDAATRRWRNAGVAG